ncbi:MAG: cellulase family glycosylhydrolase, partial [Verrucomicrobia bacterium]|nr:cellulase family glycosylhydrolase [Verrucomicrobiota bacterium]
AAGFKVIRMDFGWQGIERQKGQYDWSAYDQLTANLERRGLRPYYIFDYSNPLYEQTVTSRNPLNGREQRDLASPQHPDSIAAYARWAAASARHFRGHHVIWEIWNEPNISFWKPKPSVEQYAALALATCRAVREAEPDATIVGPATSGFPWDYLESFLKSGVLEYLDAVSVHPYRSYHRPPETAAADYRRLRVLIERYAPNGGKRRIPILSGEWGYATHTKGLSLEDQASFSVRQQLSNLLNHVPVSIWYDWQNDGPDPNEREDNFGTVTMELEPKPAYVALQTMTRELGAYHIARRLVLADEQDYALLMVDPVGHEKLAAWTTGKPHEVALDVRGLSAKAVTAVNGRGVSRPLKVERRRLVLTLDPLPQYLTFAKRVRVR